MKPRERCETGEQDLFRSRLDQIINMEHALVKLAKTISWRFIEASCGEVYTDGPGMPPLPTRLIAGLAILKHTFDLSDEELCARWVENPYFQYFCGEAFFCHELPFDRSSITRWRQRMGEDRIMALVTPTIKREMRRRAAIEPVIGHIKNEHRMCRNYLAHSQGDAINAILAAAGYNFRLLLNWLRLLLRLFLALLTGASRPLPA